MIHCSKATLTRLKRSNNRRHIGTRNNLTTIVIAFHCITFSIQLMLFISSIRKGTRSNYLPETANVCLCFFFKACLVPCLKFWWARRPYFVCATLRSSPCGHNVHSYMILRSFLLLDLGSYNNYILTLILFLCLLL